jgi:hypothetical protein
MMMMMMTMVMMSKYRQRREILGYHGVGVGTKV